MSHTVDQVLDAMNPNQSKYFGWNSLAIKRYKTIEFRRGSVSLSVDDISMWVELAVSFVKAALTLHPPAQLRQYPRTIGGLQAFIQQGNFPRSQGCTNHRIWIISLTARARTPGRIQFQLVLFLQRGRKKLQKRIKADSTSNQQLI